MSHSQLHGRAGPCSQGGPTLQLRPCRFTRRAELGGRGLWVPGVAAHCLRATATVRVPARVLRLLVDSPGPSCLPPSPAVLLVSSRTPCALFCLRSFTCCSVPLSSPGLHHFTRPCYVFPAPSSCLQPSTHFSVLTCLHGLMSVFPARLCTSLWRPRLFSVLR